MSNKTKRTEKDLNKVMKKIYNVYLKQLKADKQTFIANKIKSLTAEAERALDYQEKEGLYLHLVDSYNNPTGLTSNYEKGKEIYNAVINGDSHPIIDKLPSHLRLKRVDVNEHYSYALLSSHRDYDSVHVNDYNLREQLKRRGTYIYFRWCIPVFEKEKDFDKIIMRAAKQEYTEHKAFFTEKLLKNLLKLQDELAESNILSYKVESDILYNQEIIVTLTNKDNTITYLYLRPIMAGGYNIQRLHVRFISTVKSFREVEEKLQV